MEIHENFLKNMKKEMEEANMNFVIPENSTCYPNLTSDVSSPGSSPSENDLQFMIDSFVPIENFAVLDLPHECTLQSIEGVLSPPEPQPIQLSFQTPPQITPQITPQPKNTENVKKPSKKRQRTEEIIEDDTIPVKGNVKSVTLSKEKLLSMSSSQLNDHISKLSLGREFSRDEQLEIARMKRLVRNRESAHASRERKRVKMEVLEAQVRKLEQEKAAIQNFANQLSLENSALKEQLSRLHSIQNQPMQYGHTSLQLDQSPSPERFDFGKSKQSQQNTPLMNDKIKKCGTVLLVLCFAFGIFMRGSTTSRISSEASSLANSNFNYIREPIPQVVSAPVKTNFMRNNLRDPGQILKRDIKQFDSSHQKFIANEIPHKMEQHQNNQNVNIQQQQQNGNVQHDITSIESQVIPADFVNSSVPQTAISNVEESPLMQYIENKTLQSSNTAVMTCNDLRQIVPPNSVPLSPDDPVYISLLVPPSANFKYQNTIPNGENGTQFVEITCQVIEVKSVTLLNQQVSTH